MAVDIEEETAAARGGAAFVAGVDEAGRGPLAGSVYAAAVAFPAAMFDGAAESILRGAWAAVNDSKKLSARRRGELARTIKETPGCIWAAASASAEEIDALNILNATHLAMKRALDAVAARGAGPGGLFALVDGLPAKGLPCPSRAIVKGDAKSLLVAAASILAKTARDADCERLEREYPGYGFARHKGYPTKEHFAALEKLGPCKEHRRSFAPVREAAGKHGKA